MRATAKYQGDIISKSIMPPECQSTFSMCKAKFGDSLRSKTDVAMKNETLAKFVCHNVCCVIQAMHELGVSPDFAQAS